MGTTLDSHSDNSTAGIGPQKMKREREKARALMKMTSIEDQNKPKCILFDGKKDGTKVQEQRDGMLYPVTVREDHYCLVALDGGFIGHIIFQRKKRSQVRRHTVLFLRWYTFFEDNGIDLDDLVALGCDGTAVNTGVNSGALTRMGEFLGRPLQRIV